ncbi:succinate dehydrogenase subunit 5, mitochondrial-like [Punica granatum]|uniref:Succinate dehydrogenase subunit 5, mitochondrial-like n=1 Tax=Punica granatum TaxID=22663 RepID=A0A218X8N5_PUNGR|nr:succinate dehydrogenase subunit 5, mitochondrial-like [Punica granatum]OWM80742.1 hypothetical protein CDL15_Pgr006772 [Punica granatum]
MAKLVRLGLRSTTIIMRRSVSNSASSGRSTALLPQHGGVARSFFGSSVPPVASTTNRYLPSGRSRSPFVETGTGSVRRFSEDITRSPNIKDYVIYYAYKDLMADTWDDLSDSVLYDVKSALSRNTDDKAGQEILKNVFRAAEAVEEFNGALTSLKMELDDCVGMTGEDVKPLPDELTMALRTFFKRYADYLDSFGPEESYVRKKAEMELGTKMIHLKMRCAGLGSEWGKVTVLGTTGLSGSYIEQRA